MNKPFITLCLLAFAALCIQAQTPVNTRVNPSGNKANVPTGVNQHANAREAIHKNTIDPAVVNIRFWTSKLPSGNKLTVQGIVKNIGGKDFSSGAKQQQIQIWEVLTPTNRKMVQQIEFTSLRAGQEISINYERPAFKPADEFPPNYEVLIVYDPDIFKDANTNNDDANMNNNKMSKNPRG